MQLPEISRRSFLKWSTVVGAGAATGLAAANAGDLLVTTASAEAPASPITVTPHVCAMNCGSGNCVLNLQVQDGVVIRIDTDQQDLDWAPAQRGCLRGRAMRKQLYHPDRLKKPMKRVGKRGEGKFQEITWDEAYDMIAQNLDRIIKQYGNEAIFYLYGTGIMNPVFKSWPTGVVNRLLNQLGGYLNYYGTYSSAQFAFANPYTLGNGSNNSADDLVNSRLILIFADNAAETRQGGGHQYYWYLEAKKRGAKVIVFDPRLSDTAKALADEWIPIRPTTDNALINALAYVMISENLHDQAFLDKCCVGFDEEHLPESAPKNSSFKAYVMGDADGIPKTPEWAERITGVPRETIVRLAREIAGTKPVAMIQGLGWQRHAYGEQPVRALPVLAAMTGNIGIKGGSNGTRPGGHPAPSLSFPLATNPVKANISVFQWPDAITKGTELRAKDGLRGVEKLSSNIKFIWNYAGNALINQHAQINHIKEILADESLVEFILVHDIFMTPSAKYADLLLPDRSSFERTEMGRDASVMGDRLYFTPAAITPLHDTRDAWEICVNVAKRLGVEDKFTEGRTMEQWQEWMVEQLRKKNPSFPPLTELKKAPLIKSKGPQEPIVGMAAFVADPDKNPLNTPSGKIEIYSERLAKLGQDWGIPDELPPIPKYIPAWEGPDADPALKTKYPLQLIGHHVKRRVHSTHDNNPWLEEVEPQAITLNEIDAAARGIEDGDMVRIWNDRGEIHVRCVVSKTIMPGVADLPQGAWYTPNANGVCTRGAINTITKYHPSPGAKGNPQHTNLVQVAKL